MLTTHQLVLNGNLGEAWKHLAAQSQPVEKLLFFVELESTGEIWELFAPYDLKTERVVYELVQRIPELVSPDQWILFNHSLDLPLSPWHSLRENEVREREFLSLVFAFNSA